MARRKTSEAMELLRLVAEEGDLICEILREHAIIDTCDPRLARFGMEPDIVRILNAALEGEGVIMNVDFDLPSFQRCGVQLLVLPRPNGRIMISTTRSR